MTPEHSRMNKDGSGIYGLLIKYNAFLCSVIPTIHMQISGCMGILEVSQKRFIHNREGRRLSPQSGEMT